MLKFACFSPHPPLLLPDTGSPEDRKKVKKTLESLEFLGKRFQALNIEKILISAPHEDWGFNVPLFFLAKNFKGEIKTFLTSFESPKFHFELGKKIFKSQIQNSRIPVALIASGDLSHCLKEGGPYGFHPEGPKFDQALVKYLKEKNLKKFSQLDEEFPNAGECGLRSFAFLLGILEESKIKWQPKILSYEGPFGVGYLVADFKL